MATNEFYNNSDGLNIRFGLEKGTAAKMGAVEVDGDLNELRVKIGGTDVPAAASAAVVGTHPLAGIPSDAYIESATLYVNTAFVGANASLDIGLFNDDGDGTYSASVANGLVAAEAVTNLVADARIVGAGAQINTSPTGTGSRPLFVSSNYNTTAFTAGEADLVIRYRVT